MFLRREWQLRQLCRWLRGLQQGCGVASTFRGAAHLQCWWPAASSGLCQPHMHSLHAQTCLGEHRLRSDRLRLAFHPVCHACSGIRASSKALLHRPGASQQTAPRPVQRQCTGTLPCPNNRAHPAPAPSPAQAVLPEGRVPLPRQAPGQPPAVQRPQAGVPRELGCPCRAACAPCLAGMQACRAARQYVACAHCALGTAPAGKRCRLAGPTPPCRPTTAAGRISLWTCGQRERGPCPSAGVRWFRVECWLHCGGWCPPPLCEVVQMCTSGGPLPLPLPLPPLLRPAAPPPTRLAATPHAVCRPPQARRGHGLPRLHLLPAGSALHLALQPRRRAGHRGAPCMLRYAVLFLRCAVRCAELCRALEGNRFSLCYTAELPPPPAVCLPSFQAHAP